MPVRVVLATRNAGKVVEVRRILAAEPALAGLDVELVGLEEFPDAPEVEETGDTFAANALLKAHAIAAHTGLAALADDSGLCVDALGGDPGVRSARWAAGPAEQGNSDDLANLRLVLAQVAEVPDSELGAHFACAAALAVPDGRERVAEAAMRGTPRPCAARRPTGSATTRSSSRTARPGPAPSCRPRRRTR